MLEFVALCTAGLEQAPCIELKQLGYKIQKTTSGHIHFRAELRDTAILNMKLKSADRILIHVGSFEARSFNQLYDGTFSLNWKELISKRANLKVHKVKIRNSNLSATGAVASVVKKAIYTKISPETSDQQKIEYPIHIYIKNNIVSLMIDTTGKYALSRRGYRTKTSRAPLRETIAAALIIVSHWKNETLLIDPFCGSGTTLVQANELGMHAIGIDVSSFNSMISNVKVSKHNFNKLSRVIDELTSRLTYYQRGKRNVTFEEHLLHELAIFNSRYFPSPQYRKMVREGKIDEKTYASEKEKMFLPIYFDLVE
ncbi:MAG: hypothetical protein DRP20_04950, partial [Thermotogae bacterium]